MSTTPMASAILTSPCSSSPVRKPTIFCTFSSCLSSNLRNPDLHSFKLIPQTQFCSWSGLKQHGLSVPTKSFKLERRRRCRGKVVFASLFGVGAPEALVIGVVALLVFGPKGLADVARNLGKTLRAFQPTIRELQEVSREFKSTLEKEIGLDEIQNSVQSSFNSTTINSTSPSSSVYTSEDSQTVVAPNDAASPSKAYSTEDYLKVTEEQVKASATLQQKEESTSSLAETPSEPQTHTQGSIQEVAATTAAEQTTSSPAETPLESQVQSQDSVQEVSATTSAEQPKIET